MIIAVFAPLGGERIVEEAPEVAVNTTVKMRYQPPLSQNGRPLKWTRNGKPTEDDEKNEKTPVKT